MNAALLAALLQAAPVAASPLPSPPTVPTLSVRVGDRQTPLDSRVIAIGPDSVTVVYGRPRGTVPLHLEDGTEGVLPMTIPTIGYDQVLALRDHATGRVTVYPDVVERRNPLVVPAATASARDAYAVGTPRTPAEAAVGVCTPGHGR